MPVRLNRPILALIGALATGLAAVATWWLAFDSAHVGWLDARAFDGFNELNQPVFAPFALAAARLGGPDVFFPMAAAIVLLALVRRRPLFAAAAIVVLAGANLTTQFLKPVLGEPRVAEMAVASWPSGHSTAAMSLALCAVLVAPAAWRGIVAVLGACYAVAVGYSLVIMGWHMPSDIVGGFLVATTWTLLAVAALDAAGARRHQPLDLAVDGALAAGMAALATGLAVAAAVVVGPGHLVHLAAANTSFFAAVGAIALAALVLPMLTAAIARGDYVSASR